MQAEIIEEILETHFYFDDKHKHSIDPIYYVAYCKVLIDWCKSRDIELEFLPPENGSFVNIAKFKSKKLINFLLGGSGIVFAFAQFLNTDVGKGLCERFTGKSPYELAKGEEKSKSDFFEIGKNMDSNGFSLKTPNSEKPICTIKRDKFYKKIIPKQEKKKNKQIEVTFENFCINNAKIRQLKNGKVSITTEADIESVLPFLDWKSKIKFFEQINNNYNKNEETIKELFDNDIDY